MPRENKATRGRREGKKEEKKLKRKRERGEDEAPRHKMQKLQDAVEADEITRTDNENIPLEDEERGAIERPFYGMLEDEEQEYFRRADELLELNDFPSEDERSLFLANVYREADGKELKIACSQSCSRLMERLILLSSVDQKKKLFEKFGGNFAHLVQHRFASHCCETLFIQSAPVVTEELTAFSEKHNDTTRENSSESDVSMENLFLQTLDELEGNMTFLLTDRFASHTLRVLLVILSGRPLEKTSTRSLLQSKRKEKISVTGLDISHSELSLNKRSVPSSFQFAVEKIISDTIATMDTSFIRILATHPTGNPTLQLLLELELTNLSNKRSNKTEKTIISALLPDDIATDNSESSTFINGILYDAIGSHLLETICTYAPGKLFKQIYRSTFKDRMAALARNEISSYPTIRVLHRLSKEDLEEAVEAIIPQIEGLVQRSRTTVIKALLERCHARGASTTALTSSLASAYGSDSSTLLLKIACIDDISLIASTTSLAFEHTEGSSNSPSKRPAPPLRPTPLQLHGSLLAQSMLAIPGPSSTLIQDSLLALPPPTLLAISLYPTTTHVLQSALYPTPSNTVPFRRKLINALIFPPNTTSLTSGQSPITTLAFSPSGSHVLDSLLLSTTSPATSTSSTTPATTSAPLFSLTERIATALISSESELRDSYTGRIVWRNWSLDLFKRRRGDWVNKVKSSSASTLASSSHVPASHASSALPTEDAEAGETAKKGNKGAKLVKEKGSKESAKETSNGNRNQKKHHLQKTGKSAIQLAREKFAAANALKSKTNISFKGKGTGANARRVVV